MCVSVVSLEAIRRKEVVTRVSFVESKLIIETIVDVLNCSDAVWSFPILEKFVGSFALRIEASEHDPIVEGELDIWIASFAEASVSLIAMIVENVLGIFVIGRGRGEEFIDSGN